MKKWKLMEQVQELEKRLEQSEKSEVRRKREAQDWAARCQTAEEALNALRVKYAEQEKAEFIEAADLGELPIVVEEDECPHCGAECEITGVAIGYLGANLYHRACVTGKHWPRWEFVCRYEAWYEGVPGAGRLLRSRLSPDVPWEEAEEGTAWSTVQGLTPC